MRSTRVVAIGLISVFALSGCSSMFAAAAQVSTDDGESSVNDSSSNGGISYSNNIQIAATFTRNGETAITYDPALVPAGGRAALNADTSGSGTTVTLAVRGLLPDRTYGAHVHTDSCGTTPEAAGPRFQSQVDPVQPSVDPAFANPENEIWLDLATDENGAGSATSNVTWGVSSDRRPGSIVLHTEPTSVDPGSAGEAGTRAACVNVEF